MRTIGKLLRPASEDPVIVNSSTCFGLDCTNGESFGFDTLRLKENNLRIKFQDTRGNRQSPRNDWQLESSESAY